MGSERSSFLSDVLVHLHQGLLLNSPKLDANQTGVVPNIVKMLNIADESCTNAKVGICQSNQVFLHVSLLTTFGHLEHFSCASFKNMKETKLKIQ